MNAFEKSISSSQVRIDYMREVEGLLELVVVELVCIYDLRGGSLLALVLHLSQAPLHPLMMKLLFVFSKEVVWLLLFFEVVVLFAEI